MSFLLEREREREKESDDKVMSIIKILSNSKRAKQQAKSRVYE